MSRTIVAEMWTGAARLRRLGPDDPDPTVDELDAIAVALTASNDGVRPVVRVLDESTIPAKSFGAAGSLP